MSARALPAGAPTRTLRAPLAAAAAVARFELHHRLRTPGPLVAAALFLAILALGHRAWWSAPLPRPDGDRLFGYAFTAAAVVLLRTGLAADRATGFHECIVGNLVGAGAYVAGKVAAAAAQLAALAGIGFVAALALSAGDAVYAGWYASLFFLLAWVFLPAVVLAEVAVETRYPAAVVLVAFVVAVAALEPYYGARAVVLGLGVPVRRYALDALGPLALRALLATCALPLLHPLCRLRLPPAPERAGG